MRARRLLRLLRPLWLILFLALALWLYAVPPDSRSGGVFELIPWLRKTVLAAQITPALAAGLGAAAVLTLSALLLSSLFFGRVFCSLLCPAGIAQELAHRIGGRLKTSRLRFVRPARRVWIWLVVGLCGLLGVAAHPGGAFTADMGDPAGLFGRLAAVLGELGRRLALGNEAFALSWAMLATAALGVPLLLLLPLVRGRWFCDRLCPAGAALGLFAGRARRRIFLDEKRCSGCGKCVRVCPMRCIDPRGGGLDFSRCVLCLECLAVCPGGAVRYGAGGSAAGTDRRADPARRSFLLAAAAWPAGAFYLSSRFLGERFPFRARERCGAGLEAPMPPGAHDWRRYRQRCVGCWSCVQACPEGILRPSSVWRAPLLDFRRGYCRYDCVKCSEACPSRAIAPLTVEEKKVARVALSSIELLRCVAVADGEACGACAELCPTYALTMRHRPGGRPSLPDFDPRYCIGCGACVVACPVDAFVMTPLARQETSDGVRDTGPPPMEVEPPGADGLYDFPV